VQAFDECKFRHCTLVADAVVQAAASLVLLHQLHRVADDYN
jgi:hypothetical protein